jgi:hypothetical protein
MKMTCATCGSAFDETEFQQLTDTFPAYLGGECPRCYRITRLELLVNEMGELMKIDRLRHERDYNLSLERDYSRYLAEQKQYKYGSEQYNNLDERLDTLETLMSKRGLI